MTLPMIIASGAEFSADRAFRYLLYRVWDPDRPPLNVIGLNPSTADEFVNDPTIRRCIGFARDWGHGALLMTNIFALRSTDPRALYTDPGTAIGPDNDHYLASVPVCSYLVPELGVLQPASRVLAAWGNHGLLAGRGSRVAELVGADKLECLARNGYGRGEPKHPLYVPADARPVPYSPFEVQV